MKTLKNLIESKVDPADKKAAKSIEKAYPDVKFKEVTRKAVITFKMKDFIDENEFDNFAKIDGIMVFLKKQYKGAIVKHDFDKFIVEEL
jgi:hypothetical protein